MSRVKLNKQNLNDEQKTFFNPAYKSQIQQEQLWKQHPRHALCLRIFSFVATGGK